MEQGSQAFVLIGGIGSGKSYVSAIFVAHQVDMIEADRIGHEVLLPDGAAFEGVVARWPEVVAENVIDRRALGQIVFSSPEALAALEAITHPVISEEIERRIHVSSAVLVGIERPLIDGVIGAGLPVVAVDAPTGMRVERLLARGMTAAEIDQRLMVQPARDRWLEAADFVIDNGPGADVVAQVKSAIAWLSDFVTPNR